MTIPATNSQLLLNQDWTKIFQSLPNAEFQSYDFDTLRRILISYLQENYPEDFNDFIESSEYIALVELIAYLGQNLSFRVDLNARENFLETAQRRDSILRLAQLVSYVPKRNVPASGMLKISAVTTTGNVFDATGNNLANTPVIWNDPTNANWYQQFITILNTAMPGLMAFGTPNDSGTIGGILTQQYTINSSNTDVPIFQFSQNINGSSMNFEVVSSTFSGKDFVYEDTPLPGNVFNLIYQNDNQGPGSPSSGFFAMFKQGSTAASNFTIANPVPNEIVGINVSNINNTDVWLWQLDPAGNYSTLWTRVPGISGNNVIYNSLNLKNRNLYSITTRDQDQIDLNFSDGNFGNLPTGQFQIFYRQSNGSTYTIKPEQLTGVTVDIPYIDKSGINQTLSLILNLEYTVSNSSATESNISIQKNAPQQYYTQNRMVTAEDYNIAPLTYTTNVLKVHSVNRISSGISKYFELSDVSGKYSQTNIFCNDGILTKKLTTSTTEFSFNTQNDIWATFKNELNPIVASSELYSFYLDAYRSYKPVISSNLLDYAWVQSQVVAGQSRGYFTIVNSSNGLTSPAAVGPSYSSLPYILYYITPGAMIKFQAPKDIYDRQQYFDANGNFTVVTPTEDPTVSLYLWTTVQQVIGTGSNNGLGNLSDGTGPVIFTNVIPNGALPVEIIPAYINNLGYTFETNLINLVSSNLTFGLTINPNTRNWTIIPGSDLNQNFVDPSTMFNYASDTSNTNLDASWLIMFINVGNNKYRIVSKQEQFIFQSAEQTGFYVDTSSINFDYTNNTVVKDKITILSVNASNTNTNGIAKGFPLPADYVWQIDGTIVEPDGYIDPSTILISNYQNQNSQQFSQIVNPDAFNNIVGTSTATIMLNGTPTVLPGRANLKFQYQHNPSNDVRVDPAKSNIIDVYMLTADYDAAFRNWLSSGGTKPTPPTTSDLANNYSSVLEPIKTISDQIVYQPASYKILFGNAADTNLQATFKVVQSPTSVLSANAIRSQVLNAINAFFALENWDFGQSFYFSELSTYIMNILTPDITNFLLVPVSSGFGNLYEVACQSNEIFISGATAANIQVISAATPAQLNISGN